MFGGNASSEIRMWMSGAHGPNMRETGLLEELEMENQYRNPDKNCYIWDGVMFNLVRQEADIEILLNCTCMGCCMEGNRIHSVTGYQMTTQTMHTIEAELFMDCSGDSVLAPLTGAAFRMGREGKKEFDEVFAPDLPDKRTMGMTISVCAREESQPSVFTPPAWAYHYTKENLLPYRVPSLQNVRDNMWYIELGGEHDSIADTETLRDELLKIAYGIWDWLKNDPENREINRNWRLDWIGMLPGKRESRRYVGDYLMTQHDVSDGGHFEDTVAYGGWTMDDHHPAGFANHAVMPNIFHPAPSPYGIPYRCLYARDIENMLFAGRNISVTHSAVSSTRVQGTCALLGQAAGTAAAIALKYGVTPRGVYRHHLKELQQTLMTDDVYLPGFKRELSDVTLKAKLDCQAANAAKLINGLDRPVDAEDNGCYLEKGQPVTFTFDAPRQITGLRVVFDSDLNRDTLPEAARNLKKNIIHHRPLDWQDSFVPPTMVKAFRVEGVGANGSVTTLYEETNNYFRLRKIPLRAEVVQLRFIPLETWGHDRCHVFSLDVQ